MRRFSLPLILTLACASLATASESYYSEPALFSKRPSDSKSLVTIDRFGPVGMSVELIQPAFTMRVGTIEEGSPAAATGKLKKGQIIESINGETLKDIDPRIQLAQMITKAEASDGKLRFAIQGEAEPVVVQLPILGAYSETWPLNCPKSDKIVRNMADYLASPDANRGISDIGMIFLLSTGNEKDLEVVGEWARKMKPSQYAWYLGFAGIPLCEYYLRTGDKEVLPTIQEAVDKAVAGQYLDGWAGRGGVPRVTYGYGHLNAAGTGVVTFLMLAKECGADVPNHTLLGALRHFYRYAGRGSNPYGDNRPEMGFVDNGKNGNLAFAMQAAAALTPNGEDSVYAKARDVAAMTAFYTTTFMLHGHTGGGIGEIWRSASMGLLREKKPKQYRDFMDKRLFHYELSRRFDGSFGILGGGGYDDPKWGAAYGWAYTVPRQQLRIFGAPPTKYSKSYKLPEQIWGNEADNTFLSLEAVPNAGGEQQDLSDETLAEDSSMQFLRRIHGKSVSDDIIRRYVHHQDAVIRLTAATKALGVNRGYIGWREPGGKARPELMMEFLHSESPRVRRAMFNAIAESLKEEQQMKLLTPEVFDLAIQAIEDPKESWWVKDAALHVVSYGMPDQVVPHVDLLLAYLDAEDWWLQNAAMKALIPVVADERCYEKVLPRLGEVIRTNQRAALTLGLMKPIRDKIKLATPKVHELAVETLRESYTGYAGEPTAPGGLDVSRTVDAHLEYIANSLADVPGGMDALFEIAQARYPNKPLPYKELFLNADPELFGPKLKQAITPIINEELIPEFVGKNREKLRELARLEVQNFRCGGPGEHIDELVALHERAGTDAYNWTTFADFKTSDWHYHTFNPIPSEQVPFDRLICRYREITMPEGMEQWFAPDFDPAEAGWKIGQAPFGNYNDEIPKGPVSKCDKDGIGPCLGPYCFGDTPVNTLWDKEVLLLRKTVQLPPLKDGHRYRLRVNQLAHVGNGNGFGVYVNGKLLIEMEKGLGRGMGEKPYGAYITKEWLDEFSKDEVTIAVKSFLRYNDKYKAKPTERVPQGRISVHIEEQKLPPMGDDLVYQSARVVPMMTSDWMRARYEESEELDLDSLLFVWDGQLEKNPQLPGKWNLVTEVDSVDAFDPSAKHGNVRRPIFKTGTFNADGTTDKPILIWSGEWLMDLDDYQALRTKTKTIDGAEYLFVESGNFNRRDKHGTEVMWQVFSR
ncbi:hypothetical protein DDZ13_11750 [Coraliomargarita sinensis]|uniref:PDZ domain-containing protein n=1 Tax=Coraliomargarita sinensis TaxID=2174842 RepID=A0A317ZGL1_9BACT|nr:DUF6288 domain-containing protein [Coraliomargarita sinensis]PXA03363.1 hypothetical protein DDZ13_11750 [Coraliomargarita sinensis]